MENTIPTVIFTEAFIIKDLVLASLTSMMNVHIKDTFGLLHNIDDRINTGKTTLSDLSKQIASAYLFYLKYLPIISSEQYNKYQR